MTAPGLRLAGWLLLAAAVLAIPAGWLVMRGWLASTAEAGAAGDGFAIVVVLGASVGAFLVLIAMMMFMLARRAAAEDGLRPGVDR